MLYVLAYLLCQIRFRKKLLGDIERLIGAIALPDDWRDRVHQLMISNATPDEDGARAKRSELKEDIRRLNLQYQMRVIGDDEFVTSAGAVKAELGRLERQSIQVPLHTEQAGDIMITVQQSWKRADKAQKRDMLALLFDAVDVDVSNGTIVSVQPHPDFIPLIKHTGLVERDGRFCFVRNSHQA